MEKDIQKTFNNHRIEHNGNSWTIDAKHNPGTKSLKVYRVRGDVTTEDYKEAIAEFCALIGANKFTVFGRGLR